MTRIGSGRRIRPRAAGGDVAPRAGLRVRQALGVLALALSAAISGCHAMGPPPSAVLDRPPGPPEPKTEPTRPPESEPPPMALPDRAPVAAAVPVAPQTEAARLVAQAERFAAEGQPAAARDAYQFVVRSYRADPARATALFELGRLLVDPASSLRDYRAAYQAFDRLVGEYPESRFAPEARAWRAALGELLAREGEAARLKEDLRRLKRIDLDIEKRQ